MNVRAKFYVTSVARTASQPTATGTPGAPVSEQITLAPVYGEENKPWSQYTPCGQLQMTITNPAALGAFEPGKAYYLDISPAE